MIILSEQQSKTLKYSVYNDIKKEKNQELLTFEKPEPEIVFCYFKWYIT